MIFKIKATIAYDGSKFLGSQIQKERTQTVANRIKEALEKFNINSKLLFSGRTDKGVHSTGQVISFEVPHFWKDIKKLQNLLNRTLYPSIYIKRVEIVNPSFHPRFDAKRRVYRYIISTQKFSPFLANFVTFVEKIDEERIKKAIKLFEGRHNFEYFKKSGSDVINFEREIFKTDFYKYKNFYIFYFEADGFLRSQIRMMVDFLLKISEKRLTNQDLITQLNRKRLISSNLAKPNGLYLAKIIY